MTSIATLEGVGAPMAPSHVATGIAADVLAAIRLAGINLAIWERDLPPALERAVASLDLGALREIRVTATPEESADALFAAARPFVGGSGLAALVADAAALGRRFAETMGLSEIELRLERVVTNGCYKYHADHVPARLITSYRGRGTEWLAEADAAALAAGAAPDGMTPRRLAPGHVGLFKGRIATSAPIVHRSPPIAGTGEERLLLVVNPAPEAGVAYSGGR